LVFPMALARIFSSSPEQTTALSQQLQQLGYTVEVLSPNDAPATLADLEIQLEVCDPADVLRRATELAARMQCDIAVAPGALQAGPPAQAAALSPPPEGLMPSAIPSPDQAATVKTAALRPALPAPMERHPLDPALQEPVRQKEVNEENEALVASPNVLPRAARSLGAALARCAASADELLAACGAQFRESRELARIGLAKAQATREERLLNLTCRRADDQRHTLELKAGRQAVAAYLLRLQQEDPDAFGDARSPSMRDAAPVAKQSPFNWKMIQRIRFRKWEAGLAGAVFASALLGIGLAVASFHPRPTLSANRGDTLPPAVVAPPKPSPKPASPPRPSPAVRKVTPKPAVQASRTQPKTAQPKTPQRSQDLVARDVTVRHIPAPKPTPRVQADGWKHFSDMAN
jgi:hypothetical protein